jgi:DNA-binding NarL/FixJ family response regulator
MKVTLSARQTQILELLVHGFSQALIAKEIGLNQKTIHTHLRWAASKFGIKSLKDGGRTELIRCAKAYFSFVRGQPATAGTSPEVLVASGVSTGDA